jgi:hypothetical protein
MRGRGGKGVAPKARFAVDEVDKKARRARLPSVQEQTVQFKPKHGGRKRAQVPAGSQARARAAAPRTPQGAVPGPPQADNSKGVAGVCLFFFLGGLCGITDRKCRGLMACFASRDGACPHGSHAPLSAADRGRVADALEDALTTGTPRKKGRGDKGVAPPKVRFAADEVDKKARARLPSAQEQTVQFKPKQRGGKKPRVPVPAGTQASSDDEGSVGSVTPQGAVPAPQADTSKAIAGVCLLLLCGLCGGIKDKKGHGLMACFAARDGACPHGSHAPLSAADRTRVADALDSALSSGTPRLALGPGVTKQVVRRLREAPA